MATALAPFPDCQAALAALLQSLPGLPAKRTGDTRPTDLEKKLPYIEAYRFAGGNDGVTDYPEMTVNVYAPSYAMGEPMARAVEQLILAVPHAVAVGAGTVVIDDASTLNSPIEVEYGDSKVRQWTANYRLALRRPFVAR